MATIADLEVRLAGGASNTNPNASFGGAMSTVAGGVVQSQSAVSSPSIVGVSITGAAGNPVGAGTLTYSALSQTLTWRPFGGTAGSPVAVGVTGAYAVPAGNNVGLLLVTVTASALPSGDATSTVTIAHIPNLLFDDISKFESNAGDVEYRTIYLRNKAAVPTTDLIADIRAYISSQTPGADVIEIGLDPAGKNGTAASPTLNITAATWAGGVATVTADGHPHEVNDWVVVAGTTPAGFVGTFRVTAADTNSISYALTSNPGAYVSGGTLVGESSAPVGVTFASPSNADAGLAIGALDAQEFFPLRIRRTVGSGVRTATPVNPFTLAFDALI
jgi:hypothetical protein